MKVLERELWVFELNLNWGGYLGGNYESSSSTLAKEDTREGTIYEFRYANLQSKIEVRKYFY